MSDIADHAMPRPEPHAHHPFLQHHFEDLGQQHEASTLGMWMFLTTEILFFGGVLCAYWVYRDHVSRRRGRSAAEQQNKLYGGINTIVLIISSLTMALAVRNAQLGKRKATVGMLFADADLRHRSSSASRASSTTQHFHEGLFPGTHFTWNESARARAEGAALHDVLLEHDRPARAAHGHRRRPADLDDLARLARRLRPRVLRPGRDHGPLLALRRHRLDLPLPVPLPDSRCPHMADEHDPHPRTPRTSTSRRCGSTSPSSWRSPPARC